LVGPSTAVTPEPGARPFENVGAEEEKAIIFGCFYEVPVSNCHCERSEAIHGQRRKLDCFVASLLAMTRKS
jgi:hypothetical protein